MYEVTYDAIANQFYVDKYDKVGSARCVADPDAMAVLTAEFTRIKE